MSKGRAEEFYAEHKGKDFFGKLVTHMSSGPVVAAVLARSGGIKGWRTLLGPTDSKAALQDAPDSIRAVYGTDETANAAHGSDSPESAQREIKFFFPNLPLEPPEGFSPEEYVTANLQPTLLRALTAMCKEKPSAQPLEAIKWLSSWLLENKPNKGRAMAETDFALSRDELAGAEPAVMIEDVDEVVAAEADEEVLAEEIVAVEDELFAGTAEEDIAAIKLQATYRGYMTRKKLAAEAAASASDAVIIVAAAADDSELAQEEAAAQQIQTVHRGRLARRQVAKQREETAAAIKVQAAARGRIARKRVAAMKDGGDSADAASAEAVAAGSAPAEAEPAVEETAAASAEEAAEPGEEAEAPAEEAAAPAEEAAGPAEETEAPAEEAEAPAGEAEAPAEEAAAPAEEAEAPAEAPAEEAPAE